MYCLPPLSRKPSSCWSISRPSHLLPSPSRCIFHPRGYQLYHHCHQHKTTRSITISNPAVRLISPYYRRTTPTIPSSPSCWHHHAPHRPQPKHHILRPRWRRGPSPIPTPLLILWPPRSVYPHPSRVRNHFTRSSLLCR